MAKGKYADWLTPDGLLLLEGWARDALVSLGYELQECDSQFDGYSLQVKW